MQAQQQPQPNQPPSEPTAGMPEGGDTAMRQSAAETMRAAYHMRPALYVFMFDFIYRFIPQPKAQDGAEAGAGEEAPSLRTRRPANQRSAEAAAPQSAPRTQKLLIVLAIVATIFFAKSFIFTGKAPADGAAAMQPKSGESDDDAAERIAKLEEQQHPELADKPGAKVKHVDQVKMRLKMMGTLKTPEGTPP